MNQASRETRVDYDIHGRLGLRLVSPTRSLKRLVARQMDPLRASNLTRRPDVSLREIRARLAATTTYQLGDAGDNQQCVFGDSELWLSSGSGMLSIPFESIGDSCEIRYTPGLSLRRMFVSYVRPVLQLSLLVKGAVAVHSAAVSFDGKGILLAGWSESGKTEAMLGFLRNGASFVSDKWSIVSEDGNTIYNFPTPITVRGWMLDYLPELATHLAPLERWRVRAATLVGAISNGATRLSRAELARTLNSFIAPAVNLGTRVSVVPRQLFSGRGDPQSDALPLAAPLAKVFLLMTSNNRQISVRPVESSDVVSRLVDCAEYERRVLLGLYRRFKYAFPSRQNAVIEEARQREASMLTRAFQSKDVFLVEAPFPFDPLAMYEAVSPFC